MNVSWHGDKKDTLAKADPISLALIKANADRIEESYERETNRIRAFISLNSRD